MRTPSYVHDPHVVYLANILEEISGGLLQVPRAQRPFVWSLDQQLELLRSIQDGLPIGAIMVWRTRLGGIACYEKLGPHHLAAARREDSGGVHQYLLDGVQRLSTLFGALYAPQSEEPAIESDSEANGIKTIYYDLDNQDFVAFSAGEMEQTDHPELLRTDALLDTIKLVKIQRAFPADRAEEWIEVSDGIARAFREYKIPVIPLVTDELKMATRTFQRINSQGTVMSEIHMVHALTWSEDFNLLDRMEDLKSEHLAPLGWDGVKDDRIMDVCKAALGIEIYGTAADQLNESLRKNPEELEHAADNITEAARFLRERCGIHVPELVPYAHQITLLAEAFRYCPSMDEHRRELLRAWLWLTSYAELFAGISGARLQRMVNDMHAMMDDGTPRWSDARPFALRPLPPTFSFRSARAKTLALRLAARGPLDPEGEPFDAPDLLAVHGRHVLNAVLPRTRAGSLYSSPGNRFLVRPEQVAVLRRRLLDMAQGQRSAADDELLRGHVVSEKALKHLGAGNSEDFVRQRQGDLDELEAEFVKPLAERFPS